LPLNTHERPTGLSLGTLTHARTHTQPIHPSLDTYTIALNLIAGQTELKIAASAWERVKSGRSVVDNLVASGDVAYGIK
jgi:histidine ammonia-lyase